jgi:UDP-GlcNAc:undecaprenyl-phosphate GlcNAc-1-phosphate transferase
MYKYLFILLLLNIFIIKNLPFFIKKFNIYDIPDKKRKKQSYKISTIGGFVIIFNLLSFCLYDFTIGLSESYFLSYRNLFSLYFCGFFIYLVGIFDDKFSISANVRLLLCSFIIILSITINENLIIQNLRFVLFDKEIQLNKFSIIFTVISILLFINAFNMFDGINLQSGIYSLIFFIYFIVNGINVNFSIIILFSVIVFLYLNYKNFCYLGNGGAYLLSFLISFLVILNYNFGNIVNVENILVMMLIPGLDMVRVSLNRLINGQHPFIADRNHIQHLFIKKYSTVKSNLLLMLLILIPIFLFYIFNAGIGLLIGFLAYLSTIIFLKVS